MSSLFLENTNSSIFYKEITFDPYKTANITANDFTLIDINYLMSILNISNNDTTAISNLQRIIKSSTIKLENTLKSFWTPFELYEKTIRYNLIKNNYNVFCCHPYSYYCSTHQVIYINKAILGTLNAIEYYPNTWNEVDDPSTLILNTDYTFKSNVKIPYIKFLTTKELYTGTEADYSFWIDFTFGYNQSNLESVFQDALIETIQNEWSKISSCETPKINNSATNQAISTVQDLAISLNNHIYCKCIC